MKKSNSILVAIFLLSISSAYSQEIPKGVNYKRAPESVNALAKGNLEQALVSSESAPPDFFGEVVIVGPLLWKSLKPSADKVLLDAKPVVIMVQVPGAITSEGKRILTDEERKAFWKLLHLTYSKLKDGTVRKGNAEELAITGQLSPLISKSLFGSSMLVEKDLLLIFKSKGKSRVSSGSIGSVI